MKRSLPIFFLGFFLISFNLDPVLAQNTIKNLYDLQSSFTGIAKKVSPAVVFIKVENEINVMIPEGFRSPFGHHYTEDDLLNYFFGNQVRPYGQNKYQKRQEKKRELRGQGSGFIISSDGYILTNSHVVGDADVVTVSLNDGRSFQATIVGSDSESDVAVIKIDEKNLPYIKLGNSEALEVGEWVVAVGNPFGLSNSLTAGIVSAKGRNQIGIANYENFIQTDAAINPGNSGGPLVNLNSEVIGINTAIFSQSGGYVGIGFAIPSKMASIIKDQLIEKGYVTRGFLGIVIQDLSPSLAETFNLKTTKGVLISKVSENSPASRGGLMRGDIIIEFNKKPVTQSTSFKNQVAFIQPNTLVELIVLRKGKRKTISIKMGQLDNPEEYSHNDKAHNKGVNPLGLTVQPIPPDYSKKYHLKKNEGVLVTYVEPNSLAELAGIQEGTIILEINHKKPKNIADFNRSLKETDRYGNILLLIKDDRYIRYITLKLR